MKKEELLKEGFCEDEIDDLITLDNQLSSLPKGKVTPRMNSKFYQWLEKEKSLQTKPSILSLWMKRIQGPVGRVAAGIALFVAGWLGSTLISSSYDRDIRFGVLTSEVNELKQSLVLTKMQQSSSMDRIQAVNMVNELNDVDDAIIQSMLMVLISDQNDNVRLASLESLLHYADSPIVREGLIRSICLQSSPLVQLRLAEVMMNLQDPDAIPEIEKVLQSRDLNYTVRTKYNETLKSLT